MVLGAGGPACVELVFLDLTVCRGAGREGEGCEGWGKEARKSWDLGVWLGPTRLGGHRGPFLLPPALAVRPFAGALCHSHLSQDGKARAGGAAVTSRTTHRSAAGWLSWLPGPDGLSVTQLNALSSAFHVSHKVSQAHLALPGKGILGSLVLFG